MLRKGRVFDGQAWENTEIYVAQLK